MALLTAVGFGKRPCHLAENFENFISGEAIVEHFTRFCAGLNL